MSKRHANHRRVKIHRCYTVEEIARLFESHRNTVRRWIKAGLPIIDDKRPVLIHGPDLIAFLQAKRARNKKACRISEMYCVRCRLPKFPAGAIVDYEPVTDKIGNLTGICPTCEIIMNRRISVSSIAQISAELDISFPQALRHLNNSNQPTVKGALK